MHTHGMHSVLKHVAATGIGIAAGLWVGFTSHDAWWIFNGLAYFFILFGIAYFKNDEIPVKNLFFSGIYVMPVAMVTGLLVQLLKHI